MADRTPPTLEHPTDRLWAAFDRDVGHRVRLPIFAGVPPQLMDDVMFIAMARSRPAARLVARTPDIMRNLSHQTITITERCVGHVRGPIQWGETITAWGSGVGVNDVFICGTPRRDFDVPENRLLVWLLKRLVAAGRRTTTSDAAALFPADEIARVHQQGRDAQRLLSHPSLRGITVRKLDGRELRLIRKSRHLATYSPALKLAERVSSPFATMDARMFTVQATVEHHRVILMLLDAVRAHGYAVPQLTVRGDFIVSGQLRYRNPFIMVDRRLSAESGLFFGTTRIVTGTDARNGADVSGNTVVIDAPHEAVAFVEAALGSGRTRAAADGGVVQSASGLVQLPGS